MVLNGCVWASPDKFALLGLSGVVGVSPGLALATMMTSSNENIFRVFGPLYEEFTGPGEFPTQRPVTRSFDIFFDLRLNKRLNKQPWGWWFETPSWSSWRQCNDVTERMGCNFVIHRPPGIYHKATNAAVCGQWAIKHNCQNVSSLIIFTMQDIVYWIHVTKHATLRQSMENTVNLCFS